jgi:hypothetical protein
MSEGETQAKPDHPLMGMGCAIAAFFMFAVMNVFAKKLSVTHSVVENRVLPKPDSDDASAFHDLFYGAEGHIDDQE